MSKFCCTLLDDLFDEAGKKGFSVIPEKLSDNMYKIFLQSRNQDTDLKEGKLTVIEQGISYCPFCGTQLSKVVEMNKEDIIFYADKNRHLLLR